MKNINTVLLLLTACMATGLHFKKGTTHYHTNMDNYVSIHVTEKDKKINDHCNDPKLMAADIGPCFDEDLKDFDVTGDTLNDKSTHRSRRLVKHWLKWPKDSDGFVKVPYKLSTSISNITTAFYQGIHAIEQASCIRFIVKESKHLDYINLIDGRGCYSYIGRQGGSQDLSLRRFSSCARKGVAIHELLHAMGFMHTMKRKDRDDFVDVHYDNINEKEFEQFEIHENKLGAVFGEPYDTKSIMHYGNYAWAIDRNQHTLTSKNDPTEVLGQRENMTEKDVDQLNKMYECENFILRV